MIKSFIRKRKEKYYVINIVKEYLKKRDELSFDEIQHFSILEDEYISVLKNQDIFILEGSLKDIEYTLEMIDIKKQNTNRELILTILSFALSICILYIDDYKYEKLLNISPISIAIIVLVCGLFFSVSRLVKNIDVSNGYTLYLKFKKNCIRQAIDVKKENEIICNKYIV